MSSTLLSRMSIGRRIGLFSAALTALTAGAIIITVIILARQGAVSLAETSMKSQVTLVSTTLSYAQQTMRDSALGEVDRFAAGMKRIHRGSNKVTTGAATLPELESGGVRLNGNHELLLAWKKEHPTVDAAILVKDGEAFYRAATLLKDSSGNYRHGEAVKDSYVDTVREGKDFSGTVERMGRLFALAAKPIKNEQGEVIGAITARLDVQANIALLRDELRQIKTSEHGYLGIIGKPSGDQKDPYFVLHPQLEGKKFSELPPQVPLAPLQAMLAKDEGVENYVWVDADGSTSKAMLVFKTHPKLNWVIYARTSVEDYTGANAPLVRGVIAVCVLAGVLSVLAFIVILRGALRPLGDTISTVEEIGNGNLGVHIRADADSQDEVQRFLCGLERSTGAIRQLLQSAQQISHEVRSAASTMTDRSGAMSSATGEQAEAAAAVAAAAEQLLASIDQIAGSARDALAQVEAAVQQVESGRQTALQAISAMRQVEGQVRNSLSDVERLGQQSQEIARVLEAIKSIAEQTNLLALNAAIEAARAGEAGRGFAVVADEVRKLAEQSSKSADTIDELLSGIAGAIRTVQQSITDTANEAASGANASQEAEHVLEAIKTSVASMADVVAMISDATGEQSSSAHSIAQGIEEVARSAESVNQHARDSQQATRQMQGSLGRLDEELSRFKV